MIDWKLISRILGQLLIMEAAVMMICAFMSWLYREPDTLAFDLAVIVTAVMGCVLQFAGSDTTNTLNRRDAYLVVTLSWVVFSIFGSIPFVASGYLSSPTDAFFETMSGFTTTGASLIDDVERLPHALLFWRSMTQWIGGLGIVFFTIAIIPSLIGGSVKVFSAEATGPMRSKLHPRLGTQAKWIWGIYLMLTVVCALLFWIEGMTVFDAFNYAMTVTATGGFATHNGNTFSFNNPFIDYTAIAFMLISGISFTLLYMTVLKGRIKAFFRNSELRLFLALITGATIAIAFILIFSCDYGFEKAIRSSLFQVVSFVTTTGIFNDDAGQWPHLIWVILCLLMFIGGCSGSTAGGIKCVRAVMLFEVIRNEVKHVLHPRSVLPVKVNGMAVPTSKQTSLLAFLGLYLALCFVTYFVMTLAGVDSTNSFTIALSCASNVGPTLDIGIGPMMSWNAFTVAGKWLLSLLMLMGRLEVVSVLVLFTRAFWRDR